MSPLRLSVFRSLPYLIYIGLITAYYSSDFENLLWSNIGLPNLVYRNDYHDFTTFLRCDENRDVITRWYRELSLSPPSLLSLYSSACFISSTDFASSSDVLVRWADLCSLSYNSTTLPNKSKNPIFLVQIKNSFVYLAWPGMRLSFSDIRQSLRAQHGLLLIDAVLNKVLIKVAANRFAPGYFAIILCRFLPFSLSQRLFF